MTRDELSLLLYLETRAVDHRGAIDPRHMNDEDFAIAERWNKSGYVAFCRILAADCTEVRTHLCRLSEAAWADAHAERRARAERLWAGRSWMTTEEAREGE